MNLKTALLWAAVVLVMAIPSVQARNPDKGGGGNPPTAARNFGGFTAQCNAVNSAADAGFINLPSVGEAVQLHVKKNAVAATNVLGLDSSNVTMLGGIQFSVTGASINTNNFVVTVFYTAPGDNVVTARYCTFADGGIQQGNAANSYFVGVLHRNGNTQIPAGSRINGLQVQLKGTNGQVTNNIYGLSFTGFGGVGYDLSSPAAFCN